MKDGRESELLALGKSFYEKKEYQKAIRVFKQILDDNPQEIEAYFHLANLFHTTGQISQSIKAFQRLLEIDPDHTEAAICLSILLNDIGMYEEAQKMFERAQRKVKGSAKGSSAQDPYLNKKFAYKHFELGELYLGHDRYEEALHEYQKALKLDTNYMECRIQMAKTYARKGFVAKAFEELKQLKTDHPTYLPARVALGVLYYGYGHVLEAQEEWKKVLAKDPAHADAQMYMRMSQAATETSLHFPTEE